jgi:hypothetical protein
MFDDGCYQPVKSFVAPKYVDSSYSNFTVATSQQMDQFQNYRRA